MKEIRVLKTVAGMVMHDSVDGKEPKGPFLTIGEFDVKMTSDFTGKTLSINNKEMGIGFLVPIEAIKNELMEVLSE